MIALPGFFDQSGRSTSIACAVAAECLWNVPGVALAGRMRTMERDKQTLEYGRVPNKARRWRHSITFDIAKGILFAYIVAMALIGFVWIADRIVQWHGGH